MGRYTFPAFQNATTPRYVVVWDLQSQLIDCQRLEPAADLSGAVAAVIERLAGEGWRPEASSDYGFVFIQRGDDRRLLMLMPRDPYQKTSQSFSPFFDGYEMTAHFGTRPQPTAPVFPPINSSRRSVSLTFSKKNSSARWRVRTQPR
jgi:hypothetical protein